MLDGDSEEHPLAVAERADHHTDHEAIVAQQGATGVAELHGRLRLDRRRDPRNLVAIALAVFALLLAKGSYADEARHGRTFEQWRAAALSADPGSRQRAVEELRFFGSKAIPTLVRALPDSNAAVRKVAREGLASIDPTIVAAGSVCWAKDGSGRWGLAWGTIRNSCERVPSCGGSRCSVDSARYLLNRSNSLLVTCGTDQVQFTGIAEEPLQRGLDFAKSKTGPCDFRCCGLTTPKVSMPQAVVLAIPGIDFWQAVFPLDLSQPWRDPGYFGLSLNEFYLERRQPITVFPFVRWADRDPDGTARAVEALRLEIRRISGFASRRNASFNIVAHSWGGVLAYLALTGMKGPAAPLVDHFVTLGSPVGFLLELPSDKVKCRLSALDLNPVRALVKRELCDAISGELLKSIAKSSRVGRHWVNYYSMADSISSRVPEPPATRNISVGSIGGLMNDHVQYYDWRYKAGSVLFPDSADAKRVRETATGVLTELGMAFLSTRRFELAEQPPSLFIDFGFCPGEGCSYTQWRVEKDTVLFAEPSQESGAVGRVRAGDKVEGLTGEIWVRPGRVRVKHDRPPYRAGEILYVLGYEGEGFSKIWYRGEIRSELWGNEKECSPAAQEACNWVAEEQQAQEVWWIKIKTDSGRVGWTNEGGNFNQCLLSSICG